MSQQALLCDEPWDGSTCNGTLSSVELGGVLTLAEPFDWEAIDPAELGALFVAGFSVVLSVWVVAFGASAVLQVVRRS